MVNMNLLNLQNVNGQQNVLLEAYENRWRPTDPSSEYAPPAPLRPTTTFSPRGLLRMPPTSV